MEDSDIFNLLPDAICIIDLHGNITRCNIQFEKTIIKSTAVVNFFNDVVHSQHHGNIGLTMENMKKSNAESRACTALGLINTMTRSERQQFPVYRLIDWSISCMSSCNLFILSGREVSHSDENPTTTCDLFLPSVDMKLQSNEPFADMTSELIDFFQNAPIALHWLSDAGVILWANNFEMLCLGYASDEYIGHNITEFLLPGEEVQLLEVFTDLLAGQTIRNKSFLFRAKNGGTKYLTVDSNVYFHEDGSFRHTRCFLRNDTERRIKEEIFLESIRIMKQEAEAKSTFIRHVFHEMRPPLCIMSSFLSSLNPTAEAFNEMKLHTDLTLCKVEAFATIYPEDVSPMTMSPSPAS